MFNSAIDNLNVKTQTGLPDKNVSNANRRHKDVHNNKSEMKTKFDLDVSKNRYESESGYASQSDLGWSQMVFLDHPPNQNIYYVNVDGLGRPSETIQNLMRKLIRIQSVSGSTILTG